MALPSMTLAELRAAVRQRADQVHSEFVTDAELDSYINQSLYSLYDLLVTTYGDEYYSKEADATTDGSEFVALPADFYKLLGVDWLNGATNRVTLRRFERAERNRAAFRGGPTYPWFNTRYRLRANDLWLTPAPRAGTSLKILYVPRLEPLVNELFLTVSGVQEFDNLLVDYTTGNRLFIADGFMPADFAIGPTDDATAANLFSKLANLVPNLDAEIDGNVIRLKAETPVRITFRPSSSTLSFSGGSTLPFTNTYVAPTDATLITDGVSGWLEYVIVDSAIKCLQKEESDTRTFQQQRAALVQRINDSASNRDAAEPQRVSDVTRTGFGGFDDPDFGWGGGFW